MKKVLLILFLCIGSSSAQSSLLNYQGKLIATNGIPFNGTAGVILNLHTQAVDGVSVYTENVGSVVVQDGLYSFNWSGPDAAVPFTSHPELWLEISIDESPLIPRSRIVAVPYALAVRGLRISEAGFAGFSQNGNFPDLEDGFGTEPTHMLTVISEATNDTLRLVGSDAFGSGGRLDFGDRRLVSIEEYSDDNLKISAENGLIWLAPKANEGVGIGTNNPSAKLDVNGMLRLGNSESFSPAAGMIRWTGDDFEGYDGTGWVSLTNPLRDIPAFADDEAAGSAGLVSGDVYQSDGSGAAPLNVPGIVMIKQ